MNTLILFEILAKISYTSAQIVDKSKDIQYITSYFSQFYQLETS